MRPVILSKPEISRFLGGSDVGAAATFSLVPAVAEIPDVQADVAKPAEKSRAAVVEKAVVVRKKVVRVGHRQYSHSGAYAQNGGWGWPGGGWAGFSPFGNFRRF
jgi:hypothetical protein